MIRKYGWLGLVLVVIGRSRSTRTFCSDPGAPARLRRLEARPSPSQITVMDTPLGEPVGWRELELG